MGYITANWVISGKIETSSFQQPRIFNPRGERHYVCVLIPGALIGAYRNKRSHNVGWRWLSPTGGLIVNMCARLGATFMYYRFARWHVNHIHNLNCSLLAIHIPWWLIHVSEGLARLTFEGWRCKVDYIDPGFTFLAIQHSNCLLDQTDRFGRTRSHWLIILNEFKRDAF